MLAIRSWPSSDILEPCPACRGGVVCERTRSLDPRLGEGEVPLSLVLLRVGAGETLGARAGPEHPVTTCHMP